MELKTLGASFAATAAVMALPFAASALTVSCVGTPGASVINWAASSANATGTVSYLWGNGSTSANMLIAAAPGTYAMTLQGTDATSTATTTCSTTVAQAAPLISSFAAAPNTITAGQSVVLSWSVSNASSTSINNGVGTVTSTSVNVSPAITTTYQLTATNPGSSSSASVTVTVTPTAAPSTGVNAQIAALMAQINALKAQILLLIKTQTGSGSNATTTPPVLVPGLGKVCDRIEGNLSRGRHGGDVEKLQRFLTAQGLMSSSTVTGSFGPMTEKALKQFQKNNGISPTGFFGPSTLKFYTKHCEDGDDHRSSRSSVSTSTSSSTKPAVNLGGSGRDHDEDDDRGRGRGRGNSSDD